MPNWDYTLFDAVQLMIPVLCSFLSIAVVIIYLFLYKNLRMKIYLGGFLMSLGALFYVFFESLVIICGWTGALATGRIFHFTGQLSALYFLFSMPLFARSLVKEDSLPGKVSRFFSFIGLAAAVIITAAALIKPPLFISLTEKVTYGYITPGDFARGAEGVLYSLRDSVLGLYLLSLIIISIYALFLNKGDMKTLLIVVGTIWAALSAVDDLMFFHFRRNFFLTAFRFSRFSVGLSGMNFIILIALLSDYIRTQDRLVDVHEKLLVTHNRLLSSEKKYRKLAEGVDSAVFSLNSDFYITNYNQKARQFFSLKNENLKKTLPDLLRRSSDAAADGIKSSINIGQQIIQENLLQLSRDKGTVSFHSTLDDPHTKEPEEFAFHIEYHESEEGEAEYICRAEKMKANRLIRAIEKESLQLSIENYIIAIDDVTTRLTTALNKYMDQGSVLMIKLGLQELIINAIEHGNLNISFDEKTKAMEEKRYLDFIRERQKDPRYRDRTVRIDYRLSSNRVQYRICDEGEGFHLDNTMKKVGDTVDKDLLGHGRGINMAKILFDKMEYNNKGNQVLIVKEFS
ncbi:MAG: ATP-binding protein [Spirochaetales bacterium]|nr:ATP-binding protein [Spirochaetales bacterium]